MATMIAQLRIGSSATATLLGAYGPDLSRGNNPEIMASIKAHSGVFIILSTGDKSPFWYWMCDPQLDTSNAMPPKRKRP